MPVVGTPISTAPAFGLWMTEDYIDARYGSANQQILADMENDEDSGTISATIQQAINDSENEVIVNFLKNRYDPALIQSSLSDADKATLQRLTGPITEFWLHENRGDREKANPFRMQRDDVRTQLAMLTSPPLPFENYIPFLSLADRAGFHTDYAQPQAVTVSTGWPMVSVCRPVGW